MERYRKAIAAAITGVVSLIALFIPTVRDIATPEVIAAASALAATALVYAVPNAELNDAEG